MGMACLTTYNHYQLSCLKIHSISEPSPTLYRMRIWSTDMTRARSKFLYFARQVCKLTKKHVRVVSCKEIFERKRTRIKNYCVWVLYFSKTSRLNARKEYRDTTMYGAIKQLYQEITSRHAANAKRIHIIRTAVLPAKHVTRANILHFQSSK